MCWSSGVSIALDARSVICPMITRLQKRQIGFHSLSDNIDTESAGGRMVFHVLAAMAEFERSIIRERTVAGIAAARARGQRHGRRRSLTDEQCMEAYNDIDAGKHRASMFIPEP